MRDLKKTEMRKQKILKLLEKSALAYEKRRKQYGLL